MDFRWLLPKNNAGTTIQIWHTTDDDCGPACVHTEQFLYDIADLAQTLGPNDPITIEPHFLFANCTNSGVNLKLLCSLSMHVAVEVLMFVHSSFIPDCVANRVQLHTEGRKEIPFVRQSSLSSHIKHTSYPSSNAQASKAMGNICYIQRLLHRQV